MSPFGKSPFESPFTIFTNIVKSNFIPQEEKEHIALFLSRDFILPQALLIPFRSFAGRWLYANYPIIWLNKNHLTLSAVSRLVELLFLWKLTQTWKTADCLTLHCWPRRLWSNTCLCLLGDLPRTPPSLLLCSFLQVHLAIGRLFSMPIYYPSSIISLYIVTGRYTVVELYGQFWQRAQTSLLLCIFRFPFTRNYELA